MDENNTTDLAVMFVPMILLLWTVILRCCLFVCRDSTEQQTL